MARRPYRIARQEHLGDALDHLHRRKRLSWRWEYDTATSRAQYLITPTGESEQTLETKSAEAMAQRYLDELGVLWMPVPHPGGERQRGGSPKDAREHRRLVTRHMNSTSRRAGGTLHCRSVAK